MNLPSTLTPLPLGQIRPRGVFADRLRAAWASGLAEGTPSWVRHGLLVGEGRGNLLVKGWAKRSGVGDLNAAVGLEARDASTAWADDVEAQTRADRLGLDEYVCQSVWTSPGGLAVALYGPVTAKASAAGVPVELVLDTPNPDARVVEVEVFPESPVEFTLSFRLPGWSSGCLVTGQGAAGVDVEDHDGWIELRRTWNRGDQLTLRFD